LNTSTHGLPGIARSESIHNRVFWSISFICFTAVMVYFVTTALITYLNYPTQIDFNVIREWPQYFPAVSICNAVPFRLDQFIEPFFNYTRSRNITTPMNSSTNIPPYLSLSMGFFIIDRMNKNESLASFFFPLSSMLYKCTFNNLPCSEADFIPFTSAVYGLCYTFNAKMKNSSARKVRYGNEKGGDGVLDLELYMHSHQYLPYFWKGK
jgi:Amiloride-sensitive sodium channel